VTTVSKRNHWTATEHTNSIKIADNTVKKQQLNANDQQQSLLLNQHQEQNYLIESLNALWSRGMQSKRSHYS